MQCHVILISLKLSFVVLYKGAFCESIIHCYHVWRNTSVWFIDQVIIEYQLCIEYEFHFNKMRRLNSNFVIVFVHAESSFPSVFATLNKYVN